MRIYTHNGKAHADEMYACGLLILAMAQRRGIPSEKMDVEICRLASPDLLPKTELGKAEFIVDIGGIYDADRNRFDHHQKGLEKDCTATLVARHFFPSFSKNRRWREALERILILDTQGPSGLESAYGIPTIETGKFTFVEEIMVQLFEVKPTYVALFMAQLLEVCISALEQRDIAMKWLLEESEHQISFEKGVAVLDIPKDYVAEGIPVRAINSAQASLIQDKGIHVVYGWDVRNPGCRMLFRTRQGEGVVDFTRCTPEDPVFCHTGGFLLVFRPTHELEWQRLLGQAKVEAPGGV